MMSKSILTKREHEVFELLIANKSTLEIASELGISEKTVRNHISNAMQKLDVKGRAGAVVELLRLGELSLKKINILIFFSYDLMGDIVIRSLYIKKIVISSVVLFSVLLLYLFPAHEDKLNADSELEYVSDMSNYNSIFLLDKNSYVSLTNVVLTNDDIEAKARELIGILTIGGDTSKLPSGFKAIIPPDTVVRSLKYEDGLIKVDFSKDFLDVDASLEEKLVEAVIYTLTSIDDVNKVIIYVEGEILNKLPKTKINLPSTLDRSYGINKEYDFNSADKLNQVTVYYINKRNDENYYVPVTKYLNDDREKITVVIDELTNGFNSNENLMSFVNSGTEVVSTDLNGDNLSLNFNSYLFDDVNTKEVLEEVIYTICLSVYDNYNVKSVAINVDGKEVYSSVLSDFSVIKSI